MHTAFDNVQQEIIVKLFDTGYLIWGVSVLIIADKMFGIREEINLKAQKQTANRNVRTYEKYKIRFVEM